jgi:hypothetical protein
MPHPAETDRPARRRFDPPRPPVALAPVAVRPRFCSRCGGPVPDGIEPCGPCRAPHGAPTDDLIAVGEPGGDGAAATAWETCELRAVRGAVHLRLGRRWYTARDGAPGWADPTPHPPLPALPPDPRARLALARETRRLLADGWQPWRPGRGAGDTWRVRFRRRR